MGRPCASSERDRRIRVIALTSLIASAIMALAPLSSAHAQPSGGGEASTTEEPEEDAQVAEARERYAQGAEFYRRERYAAAIAEFTEAYRLWPNPTILYALGQAYEGDAQVQLAIETYQQYLDTSPETDARREEVQNRIRLLNRLLATVIVETNVPAEVYVNGELAGTAPGQIRVATGRHEFEVRADGHRTERRVVTIAAGTEHRMVFDLREEETRTEVIRVTEEREAFRFPRPVFYGAAGISGAAALTWVALAGTVKRRSNQFNDMGNPTRGEDVEIEDWERRADAMLFVSGGLVAVTVVIAVLTDWSGDEDDEDDEADDGGGEGDGDAVDDEVAGATGPVPDAAVAPTRGGAVLTVGWRR